MAIAARRFSPWSSFRELQREQDQMMRSMLNGLGVLGAPTLAPAGSAEPEATWMPAIDVVTRDSDIIVRAELGGIDPAKDVDISVHGGVLTIRGERRSEDRQENDQYVRLERHYGAFERTLAIPEGVNPDNIEAQYRDGVLQVTIPGAAQVASVRKVPVQIANRTVQGLDEAEEPKQE